MNLNLMPYKHLPPFDVDLVAARLAAQTGDDQQAEANFVYLSSAVGSPALTEWADIHFRWS